jgi:hypothetical protein
MTQLIQISDLNTTINHEPRVGSRRLADWLGFEQSHKIGDLIERNTSELRTYGEVPSTVDETPSASGGRPGKVYWLNEGQALVICALSRTPKAAAVRKALIDVYLAYRRGQAGLGLVPVKAHRRHRPRYLTLRDLLIVATAARKRFEAQTGSYGGASAIHALHDEVQTLWDKEGR